MKLLLTTIIALSGLITSSWAALKTEMVTYKQGDAVLDGYLVYDDSLTGKRPGVLVVHEWKGLKAGEWSLKQSQKRLPCQVSLKQTVLY